MQTESHIGIQMMSQLEQKKSLIEERCAAQFVRERISWKLRKGALSLPR